MAALRPPKFSWVGSGVKVFKGSSKSLRSRPNRPSWLAILKPTQCVAVRNPKSRIPKQLQHQDSSGRYANCLGSYWRVWFRRKSHLGQHPTFRSFRHDDRPSCFKTFPPNSLQHWYHVRALVSFKTACLRKWDQRPDMISMLQWEVSQIKIVCIARH